MVVLNLSMSIITLHANGLKTFNETKRLLDLKQIMTQLYAAYEKITFHMKANMAIK